MLEDYALKEMQTYTRQVLAAIGKDTTAILMVDEKLKEAGFINITKTLYIACWALGTREEAENARSDLADGYNGSITRYCHGSPW